MRVRVRVRVRVRGRVRVRVRVRVRACAGAVQELGGLGVEESGGEWLEAASAV